MKMEMSTLSASWRISLAINVMRTKRPSTSLAVVVWGELEVRVTSGRPESGCDGREALEGSTEGGGGGSEEVVAEVVEVVVAGTLGALAVGVGPETEGARAVGAWAVGAWAVGALEAEPVETGTVSGEGRAGLLPFCE